MITRKKDREQDERLDLLGREILRASSANETEAETAASSPFLYTRLRARIAQERVRREEGESWLTMLAVIWRTVPAMALVAVFAFVLFLSAGTGTSTPGSGNDYALLSETDTGVEQVVFAGAQPLSSDEVLTTILGEDEQGASK
jgi:energy-converting hydrogenase Eha subunit G